MAMQLPAIGEEVPQGLLTLPPIGGEVTEAHQAPPRPPQGDVLIGNAKMLGDVALGAFKQPGRLIQTVTKPFFGGVAALTDALYGLPAGASEDALQAKSGAQQVGGVLADVAELAAGASASGGMVYTRGAGGRFVKAPYMSTIGGRAIDMVTNVSKGAIRAAQVDLKAGGPITSEKIGQVAYKYGKAAAKLAATGLVGGAAAWKAWEALTK